MKCLHLTDYSKRARIELGPSFGQIKSLHPSIKENLAPLLANGTNIMAVQAEALNGGVEDWQLTVTSTALGGQCVMLSQTEKLSVIYAAMVNERVTYVDPLAVADLLPDGLYGLLLGTTVGVAEGKQYLKESQLRLSMLTTAMENGWRAPRFSFSLRTRSGSPYAEQWGFSIQESLGAQSLPFRLCIEQQRTGNEYILAANTDEEWKDLSTLPTGVFGAAVGMMAGLETASHISVGEGGVAPGMMAATA